MSRPRIASQLFCLLVAAAPQVTQAQSRLEAIADNIGAVEEGVVAQSPAAVTIPELVATDVTVQCPIDLLQAAYDEATTGFQASTRYVTAVEVMKLCIEHDKLFALALNNETILLEAYARMGETYDALEASDQKVQTATEVVGVLDVSETSAAIVSAAADTTVQSAMDRFKANLLICVNEDARSAQITTPVTAKFTLAITGLFNDLSIISGVEADMAARADSFAVFRTLLLTCSGFKVESKGITAGTEITLTYTPEGMAQQDVPLVATDVANDVAPVAEQDGCADPRPAAALVLRGTNEVYSGAVQGMFATASSYDEATGDYADRRFYSVGDLIAEGVTVKSVSMNMTSQNPLIFEPYAIVTDCAGDLRVKQTDMPYSAEVFSEVTIRNILTGEERSPEKVVVNPAAEN